MNITRYTDPYKLKRGCTRIEYSATDGIDNNYLVSFRFDIRLRPGTNLDLLLGIIPQQGNIRYHYADSRFFDVQSFAPAINRAYSAICQDEPRSPIYDYDSNRILNADEFGGSHDHPVTVEMDLIKNDGQPVVINLLWRYLDESPDREEQISTEINPVGVGWDSVNGRFVDHQDAAQYNSYIQQYLATLRASIAEKWQEELDTIAHRGGRI